MKPKLNAMRHILSTAAAAIAVTIAAASCSDLRTVATLSQVGEDKYLYSMDYLSEYDLDELIENDIDENVELLTFVTKKITRGLYTPKAPKAEADTQGFNCTSFQVLKADGDGYWYGRNYDFYKNPTLVITSRPKNGYASISTCDLAHIGLGLDKLPDKFVNKVFCLAAIYAPMDGINEKGLCTSIMALPKQPSQQDTEKHDVGTSILMRLFLDRCATVQEALDLAEQFDIRHDAKAGSGYHYMVADASGDCAVIEFDKEDGWKTMVVRKSADSTYMHVTNHLLSPKYYTTEPDVAVGNPHSKSWWRYETVADYMVSHNGRLTFEEAQECLAKVHWVDLVWEDGTIEDTQWSNVYDQQEISLGIRHWNNYENTVKFTL